jgi:hypothetical protein
LAPKLAFSQHKQNNQKTTKMKTVTAAIILILMMIPFARGADQINQLPLFSSSEPIELVLEMDMHKVLNDKSDDPEYNPALLIHKISNEKIQVFNIKVKARGNTRRIKDVCEFPPIKLNFEKDETTNTVFEGQDKIKMVTHCQDNDEFENYAVLEYLTYKTYNALTDYSYQVRLVHVIYRDIRQNYPDIEKTGFLIEDDDLMAKRIGGSISDKKIWSPDSCNQEVVDLFSLFQFMIGNTDWWIHKRHNVDIVNLPNDELIPVPYDFDYAGIINTPYAIPSPSLPILQVRDRFFKGSCKSWDDYQQAIDKFNVNKNNIQSIIENTSFLNKKFKKSAEKYIDSFYDIINDPSEFGEFMSQTCEHLYHIQSNAATR